MRLWKREERVKVKHNSTKTSLNSLKNRLDNKLNSIEDSSNFTNFDGHTNEVFP